MTTLTHRASLHGVRSGDFTCLDTKGEKEQSAMLKFHAPEAFDFTQSASWPIWRQRFSRFRIATKLDQEDGDVQVSSLLYAIGKEAEPIFSTFVFTADEEDNYYDAVVSKFNDHFVPRRNIIHQRAYFHKRVQWSEESVEAFVRSLYEMVLHCEFGATKGEQIRSRIVIGVADSYVSEQLQLEPELTLERAIQVTRQSELVKIQNASMRAQSVDEVGCKNKQSFYDSSKPTVVSADASSYGLGAALLQQGGELHPVAFCSRTLTPTEQRYSQVEKECLAAVWVCERFTRYLQGKQLVVADTLSRNPFTESNPTDTEVEIKTYVQAVMSIRPVTGNRLDTLRATTQVDGDLNAVGMFGRLAQGNMQTVVHSAREPVITTPFSDGSRQKIAVDICEQGGNKYLVVVDYYSRDIEIAHLSTLTSQLVIAHLKSMFIRWGIPYEVVTDNATQFTSAEFVSFAKMYDFTHTSSSPDYPQSTRAAERSIAIAKRILRQLALMSYRATPTNATGMSPAQLMTGRQVRTTVSLLPQKLQPSAIDNEQVHKKDQRTKQAYRFFYNRCHSTRNLPALQPGQSVKDKKDEEKGWHMLATVLTKAPEPRSYLVQTEQGTITRRNRRHLQSAPSPTEHGTMPNTTGDSKETLL
ncbi:hypothetical protein SRHO_G00200670 [Serrasalmus rhombeus]